MTLSYNRNFKHFKTLPQGLRLNGTTTNPNTETL